MLTTARTVQGMARIRSGQAPAWPLSSDRSVRRGSRVKCDFCVYVHQALSPVLVVLRSQSRLRLEGRTRTLSGPSPDLSPARTLGPSALMPTAYFSSLLSGSGCSNPRSTTPSAHGTVTSSVSGLLVGWPTCVKAGCDACGAHALAEGSSALAGLMILIWLAC